MKAIFTSFVALALLAGCKKVDEQKSKEDLLRGNPWRLSAGTISYYRDDILADTSFSIFKALDSCEMDNTLTFGNGMQGTESFGPKLCSSGGGDLPFEWSLFNGDNSLRIYNAEESFQGNGSIDAQLLSLTGNQFTIRYEEIYQDPMISDTDTFTIQKTYSR